MTEEREFAGPAWDNSSEYPSLESREFKSEMDNVNEAIRDIVKQGSDYVSLITTAETLTPDNIALIRQLAASQSIIDQTRILLDNLATYANSEIVVDGSNQQARQIVDRCRNMAADLAIAAEPFSQILMRAPESFISKCLEQKEFSGHTSELEFRRQERPFLLGLTEENLIQSLATNGFHAWGTQYDSIASQLRCEVTLPDGTHETMGVARAGGYLQNPDSAVRQATYEALDAAWQSQEEACAASLNAIAGWRIATNRKRSSEQHKHFLNDPLHDNRLSMGSLEAMMEAIDERIDLGQRALRIQSRVLGKERLDPWDTFAPVPAQGNSPNGRQYTFAEALELIASALAPLSQEISDFVNMMSEKKWLEGRVSDGKRPGAFCTEFAKSRTPRVFQTFRGSMDDVSTLAHELGHAFHSWVMRDLPMAECEVPMTLAETASILNENLVANALGERISNRAELAPVRWEELRSISSFLINIPVRFRFEYEFYTRRDANKLVSANDCREIMTNMWTNYYGDTFSRADDLFWAKKLHFFKTGISFYNFPYSFGYLFSQGVLATAREQGGDFYGKYVALLRDTGRMSCEDVARKHLKAELDYPSFWHKALSLVEERLTEAERFFTPYG